MVTLKAECHLAECQWYSTELVQLWKSCADPGNIVEGIQLGLTKKALTRFYFSPQLISKKSNGQFQRNLFFKVPEGVQHFTGGGGSNFFQGGGGVQLPIP